MLKKTASIVLASFRSSTGTRPPHQLGGAHKLGAPYSSHRAPQRVRLRSLLAAALLDGLFEHPAGAFSCCATLVFRSLLGPEVPSSLLAEAPR